MAHPQTNFSSNFQGVDPPLEGYWHDDPIPCGGGNVVTDIWPNPAGVPVVVKGFNALTAEDIADKLDKTGNASNTTSTFTKASGDTSSITSGSKLSVIFTAISSFFASLKALAFKDKASYNDLSSGVQSSLDKADSALQSHQDISGKADKVSNAANGDLAALDANGNLTDSGKKAADFAVSSVYNETDPRNLRSFIKCEGSGTQFYRKLATSLDVNDAGNSSVIKLEGCVGAWGSGDTTDFSIVFRTRGSVLFEASVFKRIGSNNAFDKVDFELYEESNGMYSLWLNSSGAYTKCAINAFAYGGAYIVYDGTNGTPTGTLVASASQNYKVMMVTDGDGSNVSVTPDGTSTGYDLESSTTLKAFAQKFKNLVSVLKALAFKDKASYNDLSSGVQSSLDKADSALQSHQSVTDNNPTLAWGTTSKVGKVGSTDLRVTMPANPAADKLTCYNIDDSLTSLDLNSLTTQGFYYCAGFQSSSVTLTNTPSEVDSYTKSWRLEVINQRNRVEQVLINASDNGLDATTVTGIWKRHLFPDGTNWTPWVAMRDASWINSGTFDAARIPTSLPDVTAGRASKLPATQVGSTTTPVYVDPNGQVQPCDTALVGAKRSNTATLYIAGTFGEGNIPYYHVKDIKNGCVNYVHVKDIPYNTCSITIEAPALASGEEYDYVVVFDTFTNSNLIGSIDVENCKTAGHMDNGVFVVDSMALSSANPQYVPMIVVTGNVASSKWYDRT